MAFAFSPFAIKPRPKEEEEAEEEGVQHAGASPAAPSHTAAAGGARFELLPGVIDNRNSHKGGWRRGFIAEPCPHCAAGKRVAAVGINDDPVDSPWHLLLECTHPSISTLRTQLQAAAEALLGRLAKLLPDLNPAGRDAGQQNRALGAASYIDAALAEAPAPRAAYWATAHGRFLLFKLLTVLPFPEAAVSDPKPHTLAACFGRLLDLTTAPRHHLHSFANLWVSWADKWLRNFATHRKQLLTLAVAAPNAADAPAAGGLAQ